MAAAQHLLAGLVMAHAAWLWFWLCGSLVLRPVRAPQSRAAALLDVVVTSAAGIALTGLATFALGLAHALTPLAAALAIPLLLGLLALRGDSALRAPFLRARARQLRTACAPGALIVWMLGLFLSVAALIPDTGSDATTFYLPQAFEYARAHALVVDPWLRYPWYPNNWVLIQTWPFVLGVPEAVQFVGWLTGLLALLGVYALVPAMRASDAPGRSDARVSWLGLAATLTLGFQPIFQRYSTIGMIDVPTGTLFFAAALAALVAVRERSARTLTALVVCGAFLVGAKVSFIALLPLLGGLVLIVARNAGAARRTAAVALAALALLSSPWYVRAFVLAQDPVEPLLNLRFQGVDPHFSRADLEGQIADLRTDTRPASLVLLPLRMFTDPAGRESRDLGVTLLVLCIPLPLIYLAWALIKRRRRATPLLLASIVLVYGCAYWNITSHLERYALLFMPLLAAFAGMLLAALAVRRPRARIPALAVLLALAIPSPASQAYIGTIWLTYYTNVGLYYTTPTSWLELRSPAYQQFEDLAHLLRRANALDRRVYVVELGGSDLTAQRLGLTMIGEAFGPGRFSDLGRAVNRQVLPQWFDRFHVSALLIVQSALDTGTHYAGLEQALQSMHWRTYRYAGSDWILYVAPDLPPLVIGEGHDPAAGPEGKPTAMKSPPVPEPADRYGTPDFTLPRADITPEPVGRGRSVRERGEPHERVP
jgi:hypothetical protein